MIHKKSKVLLLFLATLDSMIWGIVGAVAAYSSFSSKIYLVTAFPYIKEKQPEASSIDMETGELTF